MRPRMFKKCNALNLAPRSGTAPAPQHHYTIAAFKKRHLLRAPSSCSARLAAAVIQLVKLTPFILIYLHPKALPRAWDEPGCSPLAVNHRSLEHHRCAIQRDVCIDQARALPLRPMLNASLFMYTVTTTLVARLFTHSVQLVTQKCVSTAAFHV